MSRTGKIVAAVAVIAAIGIGGAVWFEYKDTWFPLEDEIAATVASSDAGCSEPDQPLAVTLHNQSGTDVTSMRYEVSVRRAGHSSVLHSESFTTDKILAPGEQVSYCVNRPGTNLFPSLPNPPLPSAYVEFPDELEYSVEVIHASDS